MARQHSTRSGRTRGSWTPRFAGISAAVLVTAGGVTAYLVASPAHASRGTQQLPTRVQSVQTVGIVARASGSSSGGLLANSGVGLRFGALTAADLVQGNPQWTADTMTGGTFVFIYVPDGLCLASTTQRRRPALILRRCDLQADQRWQRSGGSVPSDGHVYDQYRDLGSGRCLAVGAGQAAELAPCESTASPRQLFSFWWAA
jgi:hypothetical protein